MKNLNKISFKEMIEVIKQRCKPEYDYSINRLQRWFYTIKTLICILLNRQGDLWGKDHIDVAILNYRPAYTMDVMGGYDWTCIVVGHGYFKNWCYDKYENSDY